LTAARLPEQGPPAPAANALAKMLSLAEGEVLAGAACWSCGVPFLVVPVAGPARWRAARSSCRCGANCSRLPDAEGLSGRPHRRPALAGAHVRPRLGVAEDPATGSAAASFAGWLAQRLPQRTTARWRCGSSRASRWAGRPNCTRVRPPRGRVTAVRSRRGSDGGRGNAGRSDLNGPAARPARATSSASGQPGERWWVAGLARLAAAAAGPTGTIEHPRVFVLVQ